MGANGGGVGGAGQWYGRGRGAMAAVEAEDRGLMDVAELIALSAWVAVGLKARLKAPP